MSSLSCFMMAESVHSHRPPRTPAFLHCRLCSIYRLFTVSDGELPGARGKARWPGLTQPLPKSSGGCGEDLVDGVFKIFTFFNVSKFRCFEFVSESAVAPWGLGIGGSGRGVWEVGGSVCCLSSPPCPTPAHPPPNSCGDNLFPAVNKTCSRP